MIIIGCDGVGNGAICGPLTVAAVAVPKKWKLDGVGDSKEITAYRRAELSELILEKVSHWVIAQSSSEQTDKYGIEECDRYLMSECVRHCLDRYPDAKVIIDGGCMVPKVSPTIQKAVPKADKKFQSVGAASIIAKVFRDRQMICYSVDHMIYDLHLNKGYATRTHLDQIRKHGLTPWHRRNYNPIKKWIAEGKIQV